MKPRGLSILLVLTLIIAGGTLGQNLRFDNALAAEREASAALGARIGALARSVADLRAAQAGYVATGQDPEYWMAQVGVLASRLETELSGLRDATPSEDARAQYVAALAALADFNNIDDRARSYLGDRQLFLASDLVFMDSLQATREAGVAIDAARVHDLQAVELGVVRTAWMRFAMNAAALVFALIAAFVVVRSAATSQAAGAETAEEAEPAGEEPVRHVEAADDAPPVVVRTGGISRASLDSAAELCADLARVLDSRDLPAIVERTARILDARGVVLWAADTAGALLQPALTHGYPDRVVRRLSSLQIDGDNVTALAFRSLRPQTMNGATDEAPGAVAVPLVTTSGCVGVLAVETRGHRPPAETLALARIIAAQFSTVIQPVPASPDARKSAEA